MSYLDDEELKIDIDNEEDEEEIEGEENVDEVLIDPTDDVLDDDDLLDNELMGLGESETE